MDKGKCEVFNKNLCLGCQAQERQEDIDIAKYYCEIYKEMKNELSE